MLPIVHHIFGNDEFSFISNKYKNIDTSHCCVTSHLSLNMASYCSFRLFQVCIPVLTYVCFESYIMSAMAHIAKNTAAMSPATVKNPQAHEEFMGQLAGVLNNHGADGVLSVGLFDIDWFGKTNDEHGRDVGDAVIAGLSTHLAAAADERGSVHRYGGDAFAVLLPGLEKEEAFLLLEAARASFTKTRVVEVGDRTLELRVGVSAGLASSPDDSSDPPILMRKASEALYRAKVGGRNKVCLAREEKMVTKTSHYAQGQLYGLSRLAKRKGVGEAVMLREALDDLLRKYNS